MAGKPTPSSHDLPRQWNQAPVTLIFRVKIKGVGGGGGGGGGQRMIQRLNEESGRQENVVLSIWRWCKQGWLCLSQTTDPWPLPRYSLLTVLNKFNFMYIIKVNENRKRSRYSQYFTFRVVDFKVQWMGGHEKKIRINILKRTTLGQESLRTAGGVGFQMFLL